jgi:hypothetical protein
MKKFILLGFLVCAGFSNSDADMNEKGLLLSWGVIQQDNGIIKYKEKKSTQGSHWVYRQPLPFSAQIDYSSIPVNLKPLVIYNR